MPGAKPCAAAPAACCTSESGQPAAEAEAEPRVAQAARRGEKSGDRGGGDKRGNRPRGEDPAIADRTRAGRWSSSSSPGAEGRPEGGPPEDGEARGTKVTETTRATAAVMASEGPKARKNSNSPTTRAASR